MILKHSYKLKKISKKCMKYINRLTESESNEERLNKRIDKLQPENLQFQ